MFLDDIVSPMTMAEANNAYQRDYDSSRTGFGRPGREDDEYHVPDPVEPEYNIKVNGEVINTQPFANRAAALAWAKQAVAAGKLDPKVAMLSPIQEDSWHDGQNAWSSDRHEMVETPVNELDVNTLKSYADKRGAQVAAMKADNPNAPAGSKEWVQQAVPGQKVARAKQKIGRKELQADVEETALNAKNPQGDYEAKRKALDDLSRNKDVDQSVVQQRRLDLDKEANKKGVAEDNSAGPVAGAITRRILMQRLDLLKQYGPELVGAAVDEVADYVGDVEEIGSSDVSAWVAQVERMLKENPPEAFAEGWSDAIVSQRTGQPRTPYSVYIKGKKWKDFENDDHAENVANKLRAKFKADGRDPNVITIAPTDYDKDIKEAGVDRNAEPQPSGIPKKNEFDVKEEQKPGFGEFPPKQEITIVPPKKLKSGETYQDRNKYWQSQGQAPIYKTNEAGSPAQQAAIAIAKKKEQGVDEHIGKVKGGYRLYSHKGKNLGTFPSKAGAEKHEREVQYFKHANESVNYWTKLQNERNSKIAGLVNELTESIKDK